MLAALVALAAPATAGAAPTAKASKQKAKAPVVTNVSPLDVAVGETLTIRGRHFTAGRNRNTVVFKRDGARAIFVKAAIGTTKVLRVVVPETLPKHFREKAGAPAPTRFRLRVLSKRLSKKFTSRGRSPLVSPARPPLTKVDGDGDCDADGVRNRDEFDDDDDLLADATETAIKTDQCKADTDDDGVDDGYEYRSALDLNDDESGQPNKLLAYPYKVSYPNAGFADGQIDYDGDSLTLKEEFDLWVLTYSVTGTDPRSLDALSYSDGEQYSRSARLAGGANDGRRTPTLAAANYDKAADFAAWAAAAGYRNVWLSPPGAWWHDTASRVSYGLFDMNRAGGETAAEANYYDIRPDGWLSDDERDEDADGLTNYDETHGRMRPEYWAGCYAIEKPFHIGYAGTSHVDADTDGDGVRDGADDVDHDDVPNVMELSRIDASGWDDREPGKLCTPRTSAPALDPTNNHPNDYGRVNPFNPCLPHSVSRTCPKIVTAGTSAPFDGSPNWYALN